MLECLDIPDHSEGKRDARHWKEVLKVYIVSLVERKAVNNIVDEPQNQRVWRKERREVQQAWRWFMLYIVMYIVFLLDF